MFVAATSRCFSDLPLDAALLQLVELEYTAVEIMIHETGRAFEALGRVGRPGAGRGALPPDAPPDARGVERRHRGPRARLLPPVRRLLPLGEGHQGGDADGPIGRVGHALQRRGGAPADDGRSGRRRRASAWAC